jgi:MFS family permease
LVRSSRRSTDPIDDQRGRATGCGGDSVPSPEPRKPSSPSRQSLRGLDWFIFFLADVQTGFGPFIAVYLTTQKWTQVEIGFVLSIGGVVALIGQMPGGAIVDAARSERLVAGLSVATIAVSALGYAVWPIFPVVVAAATLHAAASCVLGPAIAAISLGLVGPAAIGERFGRNARYASLGNGVAAAVMGTCGYFLSSRSVFLVTFLLAIPTLLALKSIREREIDVAHAHGAVAREGSQDSAGVNASIFGLLRQRSLLIFAAAVLLLQLANAAMLPLMAGVVTTRSSQWAPVLIAACIIVPQAIVALDVAIGRAQGAAMGTAAAAAAGLCRIGDPRPAVCDRARSVSAGDGAGVRWCYRRSIQRHGASDRRRRRVRQRPLQSGARYCRHGDRYRSLLEHRARRLRQRQVRR